jgi:hypothetical protein
MTWVEITRRSIGPRMGADCPLRAAAIGAQYHTGTRVSVRPEPRPAMAAHHRPNRDRSCQSMPMVA